MKNVVKKSKIKYLDFQRQIELFDKQNYQYRHFDEENACFYHQFHQLINKTKNVQESIKSEGRIKNDSKPILGKLL